MPATTSKVLAALNGTTHDANGYAQTPPVAGGRNLAIMVLNEEFVTVSPSIPGAYLIGSVAHSVLSATGAAPAPGGNGVVLNGATYAVTINEGTGYIEVQQTSP